MVRRWAVVLCMVGACGDNLSWSSTACVLSDDLPSMQLQGISSDGSYVAFIANQNLFVTSTECGSKPIMVAQDIGRAWFCGSALLAFANPYTSDTSPRLLAWSPSQPSRPAESVAINVDPTATHCAPDGSYFSTEANDVLDDGQPAVTLLVHETAQLGLRQSLRLDQPRARFTHDSKTLLIAGMDLQNQLGYRLRSFTLADGTFSGPGAPIAHSRFEIAQDDQSVVYAMYAVPTQPGVLSRLSLVTSVSALLADDVISVPGRDQLLAADDQVAYITASGLTVVPLAGGPPSSLAPATSLAAHVPGLVFFYGPDLQMISTSGGSTHVFPQGVIEDTTPDHVLVVSGAQRTLVDVPSGATHRLEDGYIHAAVAHDGTVIAQLPDTSIHLVGEHDMELLPFTSLDPFIVTEDRRTIAVQQRADAPGAGVHLVTIRVP